MLNNISQSKKGQTKEAKKKVTEARNISEFSLPKGFLKLWYRSKFFFTYL